MAAFAFPGAYGRNERIGTTGTLSSRGDNPRGAAGMPKLFRVLKKPKQLEVRMQFILLGGKGGLGFRFQLFTDP
jgi:hypothetical protein